MNENKEIKESNSSAHLGIKRAIGIVSVLIFVALLVWATFYIGIPLIREVFGSESVSDIDLTEFREMVSEHPIRGRLIFIGIQILQVFIAFIPGEVVEVAAGAAFGAIGGLVLSLIGVAIGSSIIFMLTKTLGLKFVELFVSRDKFNSLPIIRSDTKLNGLTFLLYFIPGTPKDLLTYFIGLTRMKLHEFLIITLIARIPSVITSTIGGDALIEGDYRLAIIIFAVTGLVSAIGLLIYNRVFARKHEKAENSDMA